eukprot:2180923-Pyramimonas_sp.AAC.3
MLVVEKALDIRSLTCFTDYHRPRPPRVFGDWGFRDCAHRINEATLGLDIQADDPMGERCWFILCNATTTTSNECGLGLRFGLQSVVEKFKEGRWGFSLLVFADIISKYVEVERSFAGKAFDVAARRVKAKAATVPEAGATLLAHAQLKRRTKLIESLLGQLSTLPQRCNVSEFTPYPREFPATLKKLGALQGREYGEIALVAANIREERKGRPYEQRLSELRAALMGRVSLRRIWDGGVQDSSIDALVTSPTLGVDLLPSLFADKKEEVAARAMEVFLRRVYRAHHIQELSIYPGAETEPGKPVEPLWSADFTFRFRDTPPAEAPLRRGKWLVVQNLAGIEENIDAVLDDYAAKMAATKGAPPMDPPVNVLHFAVMDPVEANKAVAVTEAVLAQVEGRLRALGMRMVNVIVNQGTRPPLHHTFTECQGFKEDPIRRNMRPTFTHLLELSRLSNYDLLRFPTINRDLHIYLGEAKGGAAARSKIKNQRMFLRRISHSMDFCEGGAERMLTKALDAIELAVRDPRVEVSCPTSLFISVMPEMEGTLAETGTVVEKILSEFIAANATRLLNLRMDEMELKVLLHPVVITSPPRVLLCAGHHVITSPPRVLLCAGNSKGAHNTPESSSSFELCLDQYTRLVTHGFALRAKSARVYVFTPLVDFEPGSDVYGNVCRCARWRARTRTPWRCASWPRPSRASG